MFVAFSKIFLSFYPSKYPNENGYVAVYLEPPYIRAYTVLPNSREDCALMGSEIDRWTIPKTFEILGNLPLALIILPFS
jgi:hypothetical protein